MEKWHRDYGLRSEHGLLNVNVGEAPQTLVAKAVESTLQLLICGDNLFGSLLLCGLICRGGQEDCPGRTSGVSSVNSQ